MWGADQEMVDLGSVKIYQSRGPVQNAWGHGLFSCLKVMGLRLFC